MLIVDFMEGFVQSLDLSGKILESRIGNGVTIITVAKPYHARAGLFIEVDAIFYSITDVTQTVTGCDERFEIRFAGEILDPVNYRILPPNYFHGTPYMTNAQLTRLSDSQKVPMIYLKELFNEKSRPSEFRIRQEADLTLYFLDVANHREWSTDEHYANVIVQQSRLVEAFEEQLEENRNVADIDEFNRVHLPKFRITLTDTIFNERLSGMELKFRLPLKKCC